MHIKTFRVWLNEATKPPTLSDNQANGIKEKQR